MAELPSREKLNRLVKESIANLESLSRTDSDLRQTGIAPADENYYIIDADPEKTKTMPLIKDLAEGALFKERHLRVGSPAPDLKVKLVSGAEWSLADQRGKAVVIQFSFRGCGPCEAMYPGLRDLQTTYQDKLSVLSLMADESLDVTMEAVNSGKLTWNVYFDGERGPTMTKWGVRGFPTVYVVGPDGHIAGYSLRGEKLKAKIAELTKAE